MTSQSNSRNFLGAMVVVAIVVCIFVYLMNVPMLNSNREIIITLLSALLGRLSASVDVLIGNGNRQIEELKDENKRLKDRLDLMELHLQEYKTKNDELQNKLFELANGQ